MTVNIAGNCVKLSLDYPVGFSISNPMHVLCIVINTFTCIIDVDHKRSSRRGVYNKGGDGGGFHNLL